MQRCVHQQQGTEMNEAERLIKEHEDDDWIARTVQWRDEAAAELRRLSAINAELVSALESIAKDEYDKWSNGARAQRTALQALEKAKQ